MSLAGCLLDKISDGPIFSFSERHPARSDLIVLVAHNDDPTGELSSYCPVKLLGILLIVQHFLDQMFVFFPDEPKIGIKTVKNFCQRMQEENISRAIIVVQMGMTPSAKQALTDMAPKYILEQFLESELLINITEHEVREIFYGKFSPISMILLEYINSF